MDDVEEAIEIDEKDREKLRTKREEFFHYVRKLVDNELGKDFFEDLKKNLADDKRFEKLLNELEAEDEEKREEKFKEVMFLFLEKLKEAVRSFSGKELPAGFEEGAHQIFGLLMMLSVLENHRSVALNLLEGADIRFEMQLSLSNWACVSIVASRVGKALPRFNTDGGTDLLVEAGNDEKTTLQEIKKSIWNQITHGEPPPKEKDGESFDRSLDAELELRRKVAKMAYFVSIPDDPDHPLRNQGIIDRLFTDLPHLSSITLKKEGEEVFCTSEELMVRLIKNMLNTFKEPKKDE